MTLGELCSARGWSRQRLLRELQEGRLPLRTVPEGHVIDWHDPNVRRWLNLETSEVSFYDEKGPAGADDDEEGDAWPTLRPILRGPISRYLRTTVYIEALPPGAPADADVPSPAADAPAASPAPKRPSDAAVEQCFRDIMEERPDDPPSEAELLAEMTRPQRLGASPGLRARVRDLWKRIAPQWKRPRGHPRNFNSAKNSAT